MGPHMQIVAIPQQYHCVIGVTETARTLGDGCKDRLDVGRRRRDSAEDVAAAGLVGQGLGKFARLGLHLVEQTDVFDGSHRLVGEGCDQLDLLVGKRLDGR